MKAFPKQRLSFKEKARNDFQWAKDCINQLLTPYALDYNTITPYASHYQRMLSNYQLYNNKLNQEDFERECNPLGIDVGQYRDEIQPYNKTYNKIQVLLGEELKRPFNYKVVLSNSDGVKSKLAHKDKLLRDYVYNTIMQAIPGSETEEVMPPPEIDRYMSTSYLEAREILASKILDYLYKDLSIKDIKSEAFKHGLLSAVEAVYITVINNSPAIIPLNSLGLFYHKTNDLKYIQNSLYAGYRSYLSKGEVLDRYSEYLSEEDKERLDDEYTQASSNLTTFNRNMVVDDFTLKALGSKHSYANKHVSPDLILVEHVEWRSQRKVGFLSYINEFGESEEEIISEDFVVPNYAKRKTVTKAYNKKCTYYYWVDMVSGIQYTLTWQYIPEIWQGVRINHDMFAMIGPKEQQFRSIDNPYEVKLGFHGTIYNALNADPVSLMDRMKPFQYLYFIIMHKLKKLIAQDVGKVIQFDVTQVDPTLGWEKTLYYLKEANIQFFNPLQNADQPGAHQRSGTAAGAIDLSTSQHIVNYINLLAAIDQQISDVAGITRQREGQVANDEAVTNAQASVQLSAVITEIYFYQHAKLWEEILASLLDTTMSAWKDKSITKQYVLDDLSLATLEMSPDQLANSQFSIFVTDSSKENEVFSSLKLMSDRLLQAGKAKFTDILKIFKSNSIEELEGLISASEKAAEQQEQQRFEQEQQTAIQMQQSQQDFEREKMLSEQEHEIRIAEIESFKFLRDQDTNDNGVPDQLELEKFKVDTALKTRKLDLEEKKLEIQRKSAQKSK